ncbi:hypothetical protein G3T36_13595 [Diaminobutyricibacter tongyongensis]|uniref:Cell wall protein n=1 Tax=Leifsonia tongyongensis TaxID=1268043 RepID=A0A6L9Y041_9MICO|nr:hypothetical protein [Diaminobutyricibacter tongyongensis]NEN06895.1 hypothetical protein [Diaminobutyricibacter tongyongensis]
MSRKLLATLLLVVAGTFAAPLAANATGDDDYTSAGGCSLSPTTVQGGESATLTCVPGTFDDSESVSYVVSGQNGADAHLASFRTSLSTASVVKTSASDGGALLLVTVPRDASGAYEITGTGQTSHRATTATVTVIPADDPAGSSSTTTTTSSGSGSGLADTGSVISTSLFAAGLVLVLGGIIVVVIVTARRRRESTQR